MSNGNYSVYKKFSNLEIAEQTAEELKRHNIDVLLKDNSPEFDVSFSGSTLQNEVELKIPKSQFDKADQIFEEQAQSEISNVSEDHYLFDFKDDELYDILLKQDEWNVFDVQLAKKILSDRGKNIDEALINTLKKQRIEDLKKPEPSQKVWIVLGYVLALSTSFLGLFIGWFIWSYKKTLPNGEKIYAYSKNDRFHGRNILFIGLIILFMYILIIVNGKIWS